MKEKDLEKILKALANERRLQLLSFLRDKKEISVSVLAEKLKLSFRATSRHLRILLLANLVETEQKKRFVFYRAKPDQIKVIKEYISSI